MPYQVFGHIYLLPDCINTAPQVRIWSAAASSGEEAYTIAMLAAELVGLENLKTRLAILGTDISFQVLRQAEEGIYSEEKLHNIPSLYQKRYFSPCNGNQKAMQINDLLRPACIFRRMNLKKRPYPFKKRFHIIFCRNVLYYFAPDDREKIVNSLYESAEKGGWLIVSVTESLSNMTTKWKRMNGCAGIYRKA